MLEAIVCLSLLVAVVVPVLALSSADTDNELASGDGGYDNIMVSYRPAQPTVDFLRFLASQVKPGDVSADCIPPQYNVHVWPCYVAIPPPECHVIP